MKRITLCVLLIWFVGVVATLVAGEAGLRLNTSASVPRGLYWISARQPMRDAFVAVCPPRTPMFEQARARGYFGRGRCATGYSELIKVLAAVPGDRVRVDATGVEVGSTYWPHSAPRSVDAAGRPLPVIAPFDAALGSGSVLVMSRDCAWGFDARYFGPLRRSAVVGTAVPLLTW